MNKKVRIGLALALLLTLLATAVQAQARGSIRGTVLEDTDGDGKCEDGAPVHGMTLQFRSTHADNTTVYLQSGENGTYGLVAAGFGTWEVTAMPNDDYKITSDLTRSVFIDENEALALGVDFCAMKTDGSSDDSGSDDSSSSSDGNTVLPESGGTLANSSNGSAIALAAALGAMLFAAGAAIEVRRRQ